MHNETITAATRLSDAELLRRLADLAGCERRATADLVAHLAELDRRKLYREQGYGSLFSYCTDALRLSEHATFNRIEAARASRSFPVILGLLADGSVSLSTVRLLAPHFTRENHERLLAEARRRSKREVEAIVARLAPQSEVPAWVRKLPAPASPPVACVGPNVSDAALAEAEVRPPAAAAQNDAPAVEPGTPPVMNAAVGPASASIPSAPASRPLIVPLAQERYRIQFTASRATHEKLRRIQDLLRREIPDGDPGLIFDRALTLLLEDVARRKLAATANPRPRRGHPRSRHIPAEVKRTVWMRDHGRCAFVSRDGRRCRERTFLEFHHLNPYALGGETTALNIALRCREHNLHESELVFGRHDSGAVRGPHAPYSTWSGDGGGSHSDMCPTRPGAS